MFTLSFQMIHPNTNQIGILILLSNVLNLICLNTIYGVIRMVLRYLPPKLKSCYLHRETSLMKPTLISMEITQLWKKLLNFLVCFFTYLHRKIILTVLFSSATKLWIYYVVYHWGCDGPTLFQLYQSLIWSHTDYRCQVFDSASKTLKHKLDVVQHKALRMAMKIELEEFPLQICQDYLIIKYLCKLKTCLSHPLKSELKGDPFFVRLPITLDSHSFFNSAINLSKECDIDAMQIEPNTALQFPHGNFWFLFHHVR